MNVSKISFGNIVKVNASIMPAMEIASIANGYSGFSDTNLKKQITALFPDKQKDMVSIEVIDHKTSYLFSGKEQKEYKKLCHKKNRRIKRENMSKNQSYNVDELIDQVRAKHKQDVMAFVQRNKGEMKEISVETQPNNCSLKAINVLA